LAKHKYIETPELLLEMWEAYKADLKANPRHRYVLSQKTGTMVKEPLERPLTQEGFETYCSRVYNVTIGHYFDNPGGAYDEYRAICTRIVKERRSDQIEGGMCGQYNASITQRLNGLTDSQHHTIQAEQPIFPE
jgi:hypothetical protein